jgi:hypothetical protein
MQVPPPFRIDGNIVPPLQSIARITFESSSAGLSAARRRFEIRISAYGHLGSI